MLAGGLNVCNLCGGERHQLNAGVDLCWLVCGQRNTIWQADVGDAIQCR